ncbi:MAG: ABC transporter ATP-binding protein [Saprospiraceae bacterium]
MSDRKKLLDVKDLSISFPGLGTEVMALENISFELNRGEVLGIVGESGSGKSMTALSILQLLPASAIWKQGQIRLFLDEKAPLSLNELSDRDLQKIRGNRISIIFQDPMSSLNPVYHCGNQVAEVLQLHKGLSVREARKEVLALFELVQLFDIERIYNAYPHQLSGGQKQRIMIAMAIAAKPDLIIADEPTTSLDVTVQQQILALLIDLKDKLNIGILFISHDLGVIADIADRVLVMRNGHIVEAGTKHQILSEAKHPYTKGLLACRPPLQQRLKRLPTIADFKEGESMHLNLVYPPAAYKTHLDQLAQQSTILAVENLETWFPSKKNFWGTPTAFVKAVDGVSFTLKKGESIGLVGESGCGKTTLGRSILKLIEPQAGRIIFDGKELTELDETAMQPFRKQMQIVFQDPYASLNPRKMIGYAIIEPMKKHFPALDNAVLKEKAIQLLEKVGLSDQHFFRYPHEFSGGQRQRIAIARALAVEPAFLVCDESVSSLDVSVQAQILNLLSSLRAENGLSYLFISHDLSVVKFMADRIMVMQNGRIVEEGLADELYHHPRTEYTQKLIAAIPDFALSI